MEITQAQKFLEAVPIPMALISHDERVLVSNAAAVKLFGGTIDGRTCSAFVRHPAFFNGLEATLRQGWQGQAKVNLTDKGNETRLAISFSPIETEHGTGALVAFEDLTGMEQVLAMRRDFVANVSHELRTPLTALVGFIDTLRGAARNDPAARDRFLAIMEREAERMIRLVNDLLSLSRVEAEERRRPDAETDIVGLLRTMIASHRTLAEASDTSLTLEVGPAAVRIKADSDQIIQVFHNLIENAIKYGGAGNEVKIRVTEIEHEPVLRGPAVQIEVIDRGEGIDVLHVPRLTERFYRIDAHRSREKGGTGLGLAIVKHIVNRHRGRLRIESELGKGSRFIVILPAR